MSSLDPLVDRLRSAEADEIRLESGQRICMITGGRRQDVSREPVRPRAVEAICLELLSPEEMVRLAGAARTLPLSRGGETFEVELSRVGREARIVVRRPRGGRRAEPTGAYASVEVAAVLRGTPARARRPVVGGRPVDELLALMVGRGASDLHLSSGCRPVLRVDGAIRFLEERQELSPEQITQLLEPVLTEKARQELAQTRDADFAYEVEGLARFRVNVFHDRKGVGAVFRQIPIEVIPAEKLGLPPAVLGMCQLSKGLVIVTGPTGSGKSTTLAAMVDHINKTRDDHIITIEDPIEFVHPNIRCLVNQREVSSHTRSFKSALRAALREDPDIVLVGEMRDLETISIALETAETGHLVFGTLHTTTAVSTIDRIIDQFPVDQQAQVRVMLSESLKGVVAQVLLPKNGGGRVAAMEILLVNMAVSSLIRESKSFQIPSIMQTRKADGMVMMNDSLLMLVKKGLVSARDAWMKAVDKAGLVRLFEQHGVQGSFS
jgi:twitching motility protein PilT